ncbi:UNVERIFIED_CONTAM: WD repeat-containing protein 53 [Siphonaria sp. JEL0065]|nr:WD repeat-containing protein 53 [Siphonaria sp. JEL0065]
MKFQENTKPVQDLSLSADGQHLASGSQSGSVFVYDVMTRQRTFSAELSESVGAVAFVSPFLVAAGAEDRVAVVDLRCSAAAKEAVTFTCADDVNAIAFNGAFGAAVDDSGAATILDWRQTSKTKVFKGWTAHDNIAMAAAFTRADRPWELWTGGFDCCVRRWDFSNGACSEEWNLSVSANLDLESATQSINPCFVEALDIASNGRRVVAGLGNGSIAFFDREKPAVPTSSTSSSSSKKKKKKTVPHSLSIFPSCHSWSCTALQFADNPISNTKDAFVVSGGLDGKLALIQCLPDSDSDVDASSFATSAFVKSYTNVYRKVDTLLCLPPTADATSLRVLVGGCALDKRKQGDIDVWEIPLDL